MTSFVQGSPDWHAWRARSLSDLFFFADVILGYGPKVPMSAVEHALMCRFVERSTGNALIDDAPYQLVLVPREVGKTTIVTQARPIQLLCRDPNTSILIANEKEDNAKLMLAEIKRQFESNELLRALFPELLPPNFNDTTWSATKIEVQREGRKEPSVFVTGEGGTVTGMHPDHILGDDILSKEAMENARVGDASVMARVNRWINTLPELLSSNAKPFPTITFVGTRWWTGDSYEYLEKTFGHGEAPQYVALRAKMPTGEIISAPVTSCYRVGDVAVYKRSGYEDGKAAFPSKWPEARMTKKRFEDAAGFACLPAGELILTENGPRPIELVEESVLTGDRSYHPVLANSVRPYHGPMVRLWLYGQPHPVTVTANHRLWVAPLYARTMASQRKWCDRNGEYDWHRADTVRLGDVAEIPIEIAEWQPDGQLADPDFWYLVGHFVGDGSVNRRGVVTHYFNKRDRALAERISAIVSRLFQRKARIYEKRTANALTYSHPDAAHFFRPLRQPGVSQKWLPAQYERLPVELLQSLVAGYWSADGCELASGIRKATSVCVPWLWQLQRILAKLGIAGGIVGPAQSPPTIEGRTVNAQPVYTIAYQSRPRRRPYKLWVADGMMYRRVRKIEHFQYQGPVFNCEVEQHHSYAAASNAILYANCQVQNDPSDDAVAIFKQGWLRHFVWLDPQTVQFTAMTGKKRQLRASDLDILMFVDPGGFASSNVEDRARAAIVVTGSTGSGEHLLLEAWSEHETFLAAINQVIALSSRYGPRKVVVELAGQQAAFIELLRLTAQKSGIVLPLQVERPGLKAKANRILELEPYFQQGHLYVSKTPAMAEFLDQYQRFPRTIRVDVLDALAYGPRFWKREQVGTQNVAERRAKELEIYRARRGGG